MDDRTKDAQSTAASPDVELLSFKLADAEYSVDIMSVREIRGWTKVTTLPQSPDFVRGVINLRGSVLPVVDLATRLGLPASEPDDRNVIIVVDIDGRTVGLRVDAVSDILTIPSSALQPPPDMAADRDNRFIKSLTTLEGRMIRVLDLDGLLPRLEGVAA
jgi:purine-binding chemotaxis protein CheW